MARRRWVKWLLILLCWTLFGLFFVSQYFIRQNYYGRSFEWGHYLAVYLGSAYLWAALTPFIIYLTRRFPIQQGRWLRGILTHLFLGAAFSLVELLDFVLVSPLIGLPPLRETFFSSYTAAFVIDFHWDLLTYWAIVGLVHAFDYYRKYQDRELKASQLQTQLARAQLSALKMQLHPHFLFNTLNAVVVLVRKNNNQAAVDMLTGLSELLRYTLESISTQEVTLRQELAFLERYLDIEQVRFNDRMRVVMKIDEGALDALVPNLILQPLVENAIRHGIGRRASAGLVEISADRENGMLKLRVRDDGPGLPQGWTDADGKGIGISNTRARLEHLYGKAQGFDLRNDSAGGAVATLTLPFKLTRGEFEGQSDGKDSDADRG
jgi:two-component system LytT family sensor kinase